MILKKNCDNIFIIGNPSQYLYVIEALHYFNLQDQNNILIVSSLHNDYVNQTLSICKEDAWSEIIIVPKMIFKLWKSNYITRVFALFFSKYYFIKKTKNINVTNNIFIGNIEDRLMQLIAGCVSQTNIIALDDGNATLNTFEKLKHLKSNDFLGLNSNDKKSRLLKLNPLKVKIEEITFFTIYYNYSGISKNLNIIPNNLSFLKKLSSDKSVDKNVLFIIGSPFIRLKMITKERYWQAIKKIVELNPTYKIYYIRHRAEDNFQFNNIEVTSYDYPIEIVLQNTPTLPDKIITFFSSAAITLNKIYDSEILIENINLFNSNNIVDYYKSISSNNFIVSNIE